MIQFTLTLLTIFFKLWINSRNLTNLTKRFLILNTFSTHLFSYRIHMFIFAVWTLRVFNNAFTTHLFICKIKMFYITLSTERILLFHIIRNKTFDTNCSTIFYHLIWIFALRTDWLLFRFNFNLLNWRLSFFFTSRTLSFTNWIVILLTTIFTLPFAVIINFC